LPWLNQLTWNSSSNLQVHRSKDVIENPSDINNQNQNPSPLNTANNECISKRTKDNFSERNKKREHDHHPMTIFIKSEVTTLYHPIPPPKLLVTTAYRK
jgi:hypothetical protein